MHYLRKEVGKLISYAKAFNITVYFGTPNNHTSGEWSVDGSTITIYEIKPLVQYLSLIHELAHHKQWLDDGMSVPLQTHQAFSKYSLIEDDQNLDIKYRKLVYEAEKRDSKHQLTIHYETQSKVPLYVIKAEIQLDIWVYKCYYKTGKYPTQREKSEKRRQLRKKFKHVEKKT